MGYRFLWPRFLFDWLVAHQRHVHHFLCFDRFGLNHSGLLGKEENVRVIIK